MAPPQYSQQLSLTDSPQSSSWHQQLCPAQLILDSRGKEKDVTVKLQGLKCHLTFPNAVNTGASLVGKRQGTDKTT